MDGNPDAGSAFSSSGLALQQIPFDDGLIGDAIPVDGGEEADADHTSPTKKRGRRLARKTSSNSSPKKRTFGEPAPAPKPKAKAKAATKEKRARFCWCCQEITDDWGTKSECRPCNNDREAIGRDAKTNGEHDFFKSMTKDLAKKTDAGDRARAQFRTLMAEWRGKSGQRVALG